MAQVSAAPVTGPKLDNRRVLAAIVDLLIVGAGALVILAAGDSLTGDRQGALGAVILGWALYYYFALESGEGQTLGKKLMKLRVVRADGGQAGMREIAVRTVLRVIDGIGVYIVGLIVMLVTGERRQRIGDLAANTMVVDASGPATAVAPPPAVDAEVDADADADFEVDAGVEDEAAGEEPVAEAAPTRTITLPSRPARPETLSDLTDPPADEPVGDAEPVAEETAVEPVAQDPVRQVDEPAVEVAESAVEVEPFEVKDFEVAPYDMDKLEDEPVAEEPAVEPVAEEPVVEDDMLADAVPVAHDRVVAEEPSVEVAERPDEEPMPQVMSPSLEALAADVAAAQDPAPAEADEATEPHEASAPGEDAPEADGPVNVKSVETVSAMDLIMGAADEDAAKSDDDEGPASA